MALSSRTRSRIHKMNTAHSVLKHLSAELCNELLQKTKDELADHALLASSASSDASYETSSARLERAQDEELGTQWASTQFFHIGDDSSDDPQVCYDELDGNLHGYTAVLQESLLALRRCKHKVEAILHPQSGNAGRYEPAARSDVVNCKGENSEYYENPENSENEGNDRRSLPPVHLQSIREPEP
eukprot:TRINITY_DN26005_c0_g1_i3.p1 TRINITY_DN26005_c0_g1~~TRINITY_DN26005_c0_g1_i3.p1  ORF type:complete len:186 (-),score=34.32 TRINITY_DN26005_c0_g1_i3:290-847(-)